MLFCYKKKVFVTHAITYFEQGNGNQKEIFHREVVNFFGKKLWRWNKKPPKKKMLCFIDFRIREQAHFCEILQQLEEGLDKIFRGVFRTHPKIFDGAFIQI